MPAPSAPLYPWIPAQAGLNNGIQKRMYGNYTTSKDDYTQFNDLAAKEPEKLKKMQELFMEQAKDNKDLPIGAGIWLRLHPEDVISSPYKSWVFDENTKPPHAGVFCARPW